MKNKFFIITLLIFTICILITGCEGENNKYKEPDIEVLEGDPDYHYYYIIDNRTEVVYLLYDYGRKGGVTVMLNADGTPVLKNQLETVEKNNVE